MSHWQSKEMEATKLEAGEAKYLYNTFIQSSGTNGALCVGTVPHSLLWVEVSMELIVT